MPKTILITGATDWIGLETARMLVSLGHNVLLNGRSPAKLESVDRALSAISDAGQVESYVADLSRLADVEALAMAVAEKHSKLDVLINNAGVYSTPDPIPHEWQVRRHSGQVTEPDSRNHNGRTVWCGLSFLVGPPGSIKARGRSTFQPH